MNAKKGLVPAKILLRQYFTRGFVSLGFPLISPPLLTIFTATSDDQAMIQQDRSTGFDRILSIIETKSKNRLSKKTLIPRRISRSLKTD